ncbi:MAG: NUDIX hydrolase [Erysipelotrichaceae bacterium]|nr:NUDIX hydrolase [Erysipelotrichaceae bacterium]MBQ1512446.1 NUDIX hydrolase [Erysipelotrichaceae bacterium]MBQ1809911.1 NUDIX hydrolase [Erysipelotrichaceae bacterium]MBR3168565.1 NUDIX hydrolase [Erysipelotrichaceae bacterium]
MEKRINGKTIYSGRVIEVVCDDVGLDDGRTALREIVYHRGGCCIALRDPEDDKYYMVRQYRYAQQTEMLEFCAGKMEKGEDPSVTILRECEEELGVTAENVRSFGYIAPTCGYSSEKIYLFTGDKGKNVGMHLDEDEQIEPEKYSLDEIEEMIFRGEIFDAKTIALVYRLRAGR